MSNDTEPPDPQDETSNGSNPQVETTTTTGTGETPGTITETPSFDESQAELKRLKDSLKRANAEAKQHREKATELDRIKAETEAAKLSETEKLQKQLAELQKAHDTVTRQSQERIINYEVRLQAAQMGIVDPDAAAKLLDWSEIEYSDDGSPANVNDLLKKLLKAKPYLSGKPAPPTSGGATNPARSQSSAPPELSWAYISALKPSDWSSFTPERKREIQAWQLSNPPRF